MKATMTSNANRSLLNDSATDDDGDHLLSIPYVIMIVIPISVMILLAVGGNMLVILSYCRDRNMHTVYNFYILNLAVADMFIGLSSMGLYFVYTITKWHWPFGRAMCKVFLCVDFTLCLETVLLLIVISLDRLLLISLGTSYQQKETKCICYLKVIVTWFVAFSLYSPAIIGWDYWIGNSSVDDGDCDTEFNDSFNYTIGTAVVEFVVPFVSLVTLNMLLYCKIRKRSKVMGFAVNVKKSAIVSMANSIDRVEGSCSTETIAAAPSKRIPRDRKAAKALSLLVLIFAICWTPYTVATIVLAVCDSCVNKDLYEFMNWLLWLKSCINPFLYAYTNVQFRDNFKKIISPCVKKKAPVSTVDGQT